MAPRLLLDTEKGLEVKIRLLSLCFAIIFIAQIASADVIQLGASKDTMIFQNNVNNGLGGGPGFFAGTNSGPSIRRGLISFDLSSIPVDATITDVQLRLVIGQVAGSGGGGGGSSSPTIGLHKLFTDWGEAATGLTTAPGLGGTGQGSPALDGDSTWNSRFFNSSPAKPWTSPGGLAGTDYAASASASLGQGNAVGSISTWLSTTALVADVQGWLTAPSSNNGWMLINANEVDAQTFRGFYSRNYNPSSGVTPSELANLVPQLTVTYTPVPEPATIGFVIVAVAMIGLKVRNRRYCVA